MRNFSGKLTSVDSQRVKNSQPLGWSAQDSKLPLFTYSLTHLFTYSLAYSLIHLFTRLLTHLLTHLLTYSLTHLLTHLLTHSLTHLPTYLLTIC